MLGLSVNYTNRMTKLLTILYSEVIRKLMPVDDYYQIRLF